MLKPSTSIVASGPPDALIRLIGARAAAVARARAITKLIFAASIVAVLMAILALMAEKMIGLELLAAGIVGMAACRPGRAPVLKPADGLTGFLKAIAPELAPGGAVTIEGDLRDPMADVLAIEGGPAKSTRNGRALERQRYRDPWLKAEAALADGTVLRWRHAYLCTRVESTRRNARGKTRRKTKFKARGTYDVTAVFPAKRYLLNANRPPLDQVRSQVLEQDGRIRVRLRQSVAAKPSVSAAPLAACDEAGAWMRLAELAFRHVRPATPASRPAR
jgi:hypothetical protein